MPPEALAHANRLKVTKGYKLWSFCLFLSDAAKCMVPAGSILKSLCPRLFRVTRIAHSLHNCAVKVNLTLKMLIS